MGPKALAGPGDFEHEERDLVALQTRSARHLRRGIQPEKFDSGLQKGGILAGGAWHIVTFGLPGSKSGRPTQGC